MAERVYHEIATEIPHHRDPAFDNQSKAGDPLFEAKSIIQIEAENPELYGLRFAELRFKITQAANIPDTEKRRAALKAIKEEVQNKLNTLADEMKTDRVLKGMGAVLTTLPANAEEIYGDFQFLLEVFLDPNLPPEPTPPPPEVPLSGAEKNRLTNKEGIENLFRERGVPEREAGEPFEEYLAKVHNRLLEIAISTLWNKNYDKSEEPYTNDYRNEPTRGPIKRASLLEHPQVYDQTPSNRIRNFGSLLDMISSYFDDEHERQEVAEYGERLKALFKEISIWHNRAAIINEHYDQTGPDGSLKALQEIRKHGLDANVKDLFDDSEAFDFEKPFLKAMELCCAVWSAQSLKSYERARLEPYMSPSVVKFLDPKYRNAIPGYRTSQDQSLAVVEDMVAEAQALTGVNEKVAQLAYHVGESYRLGSGIHYQLDVVYKDGKAKVVAQDGTPKGMNMGAYVESANQTEARPDFNPVFGDYMVHGYPPYSRAAQFDHAFGFDIADHGDNRASLAEILAVDGAIQTVKWDTRSTAPDKIVLDIATQAINFFWPRASVSKSTKPENSFFLDVHNVPLAVTEMLNREDDVNRLRVLFGFTSAFSQWLLNLSKPLTGVSKEDHEVDGFDSDSNPIAADQLQHIKALYKDFRDYWINGIKVDAKNHPMDTVRLMRFMFSRDDRPATNGFVNAKAQYIIGGIGEFMKGLNKAGQVEAVSNVLIPQMQGYMNFDVLMRSVFALFKPDFRTVQQATELEGKNPADLRSIYNDLDFSTYERLVTTNRAGQRLANISQVAWLINQSLILRDIFKEESADLIASGYTLYPEYTATNYSNYTTIPEHMHNPNLGYGQMFTRYDLLRMAQEMDLGEGYKYTYMEGKNTGGKSKNETLFFQLQRVNNHPTTLQYIVDRVLLLMFLFKKDQVKLSGK